MDRSLADKGPIARFGTILLLTAEEWWQDNTLRLAAALAFYTIFSLAPLLLIVTALAGLVFDDRTATEHLVRQVQSVAGRDGATVVSGVLTGLRHEDGGLVATILGIATLVVGSTAVFGELQAALNQIWDVEAKRTDQSVIGSLIRDRLQSFGVVIGIGFLLLISLVLNAALAGAQEWLARGAPNFAWFWQTLHQLVELALTTVLFILMYRMLPDVVLAWRDVALGAAVTAVLFSVGRLAIGFYLGRKSIGSYYGAAGSFVVLLIWVYYSALICFFGAEFTHVYAKYRGARLRPEDHAARKGNKRDEPVRDPL